MVMVVWRKLLLNQEKLIGGFYLWSISTYLTEFEQMQAQHFGVGKNKQIILVLERAGWHTSDQVEVPEGIHLFFLPAYSPELPPAERLWPLANEPIANRTLRVFG